MSHGVEKCFSWLWGMGISDVIFIIIIIKSHVHRTLSKQVKYSFGGFIASMILQRKYIFLQIIQLTQFFGYHLHRIRGTMIFFSI